MLGFEQGVFVFFVGVKGVVDVLAGFCLGIYFFVGVKSVDDVLAEGVEQVVEVVGFWVQGVSDVQGVLGFVWVFISSLAQGVDDVLAGLLGAYLFVGVKGVDDVLAGLVWVLIYSLVSRASMTFLLG